MHRRPLAQPGGIEGVDQERDQKPHVAAIEADADQDGETAAADDDDDAGERDADAAGLAPASAGRGTARRSITATNSGPIDCSNSPLIAVVYCRP